MTSPDADVKTQATAPRETPTESADLFEIVAPPQVENASSDSNPDTVPPDRVVDTQATDAPQPEVEPEATISGTVTDTSGSPIANASVRVMPEMSNVAASFSDLLNQYTIAKTDAAGKFEISSISLKGQILLTAVSPGFYDAVHEMTFDSMASRRGINFALEPSHDFVGRVLDSMGNPVSGAIVIPLAFDRNVQQLGKHWRVTDDGGLFSFALQSVTDFENGVYSSSDWKGKLALLDVYAQGVGAAVFHDVPFEVGDVVDLRLPRPASLSGRVTDHKGNSLSNHIVRLGSRAGMTMPTRRAAMTDSEGHYLFADLVPNTEYSASPRDPDGNFIKFAPYDMPDMIEGSSATLDLATQASIILTGNIVADESRTVMTAHVDVLAFDLSTQKQSAMGFVQNGATSYRLSFREPGRYLVGLRYTFFFEDEERYTFPVSEEELNRFTSVEVEEGPRSST